MDIFIATNATGTMKCEDDLLSLFQSLNVRIGNLNPCVIKAWFDTDCKDLLQWVCSSITEDNYVSAQQESEYLQVENVLIGEQLNKRLSLVDNEFPDLLNVHFNLLNIEIANDTVEILEEELRNCDSQLQLNEKLHHSLSAELSRLASEEMKSQLEHDMTMESCLLLSSNLDETNRNTFEQVAKYSCYLSNFESAQVHKFVNNADVIGIEDQFSEVVHSLNSITRVDDNLLQMNQIRNLHSSVSELQERIFQSKMHNLTVQMEIAGLRSVQQFLREYNSHSLVSLTDIDSAELNVGVFSKQQLCMLKMIEEACFKASVQEMHNFTLKYYKNEHDSCLTRLSYVDKFNDCLERILVQLVVVHNLYLQEKVDLSDSLKFFKSIHNYIRKNIEDCSFRKVVMLQTIERHVNFMLEPLENRLKLISDFGKILFSGAKSSGRIAKEIACVKLKVEELKLNLLSVEEFTSMCNKLKCEVHVLVNFLENGPTHHIVTIPHKLRILLFKIEENLVGQGFAIKSLLAITKQSKEKQIEDKWLLCQNKLWILFLTDRGRMLSFINEVKSEPKRFF